MLWNNFLPVNNITKKTWNVRQNVSFSDIVSNNHGTLLKFYCSQTNIQIKGISGYEKKLFILILYSKLYLKHGLLCNNNVSVGANSNNYRDHEKCPTPVPEEECIKDQNGTSKRINRGDSSIFIRGDGVSILILKYVKPRPRGKTFAFNLHELRNTLSEATSECHIEWQQMCSSLEEDLSWNLLKDGDGDPPGIPTKYCKGLFIDSLRNDLFLIFWYLFIWIFHYSW